MISRNQVESMIESEKPVGRGRLNTSWLFAEDETVVLYQKTIAGALGLLPLAAVQPLLQFLLC